jgi:DNA-binding CsgD family transcriptional regulator
MNTAEDVKLIKMQPVSDGLLLFRKGIEYFGIIAIAFLLVKTLYQIQNRPIQELIKNIFVFILILSAFAFGVGMTTFFISQEETWLYLFCNIIWGTVILVLITIFTSTLLNKRTLNCDQGNTLHIFLLFYITILSIFFFQNLISFKYKNLFMMLIILLMNLFPIFWSKHKLRRETSYGFPSNIDPENVERFVTEYYISNREREILEHILRGYSNKEIQHRLFLSPHTVKNHNYHLYKKLGVRNRAELMRKVFEYQRSN